MGKKGKRPRFRVQFDIGKCSECKRNFTHQKKKHCTAAKQAGGTCKWMNEKRDYDRKSLTKRKALDQQQQVQEPDKPASADKAESTDQAAPINYDTKDKFKKNDTVRIKQLNVRKIVNKRAGQEGKIVRVEGSTYFVKFRRNRKTRRSGSTLPYSASSLIMVKKAPGKRNNRRRLMERLVRLERAMF